MNQWKLIAYFFIFFVVSSYAETPLSCPSITSVRQLKNIWPHGSWMPLYVKNDELAFMKDIEEFSHQAQYFIRAEWSVDFLEAGHCFYEGSAKVMLARDMLQPDSMQFPRWQFLSPKLAFCISDDENDCLYSALG